MQEDEMQYFRKRASDRENARLMEGEEMNEELIRLICAANEGYETPHLNDKLYLHFKGFKKICNLESYSNCKSLWLESNHIENIENIGHMKQLASLFLHNNRIKRISGLENLKQLISLNLASNLIEKVEGLSQLTCLNTLNLSKNLLSSVESLAHLSSCKSITNLDLSSNNIEDPEVLKIVSEMPQLVQLGLHGNDVVKNTKHYRKSVVIAVPTLTYLDQRPIFEKERVTINAWKDGGHEAEKQAAQQFRESQREKERQRRESFRAWKEEQRRKGHEQLKAGIAATPMVSYVRVDSGSSAEKPEHRRKGIVPLSHSSRPVAATHENLALYGANIHESVPALPQPANDSTATLGDGTTSAATGHGGGHKDNDGDTGGDDAPPPLPKSSTESNAIQSGKPLVKQAGVQDTWTADLDAALAKLVRKHAFDFAAVANSLRKKAKKLGLQNLSFIDGESCRLRWCGLDYVQFKKTALESPTSASGTSERTDSSHEGASKQTGSLVDSTNSTTPELPSAILNALGETDMDELD